MPFIKIANATLAEPTIQSGDWEKMWGNNAFRNCELDPTHSFCKVASMKKMSAKTTKYLLSHCTIMSSVALEKEPFDYRIRPSSAHLVNNNSDAWGREVLKLSYKSFIGAFSFQEHFQNSAYSKGAIFDTVIRKINLGPEVEDWVYYVDILVGTDFAHETLVGNIRSGKVKYLSMGCVTDLVICSYCGARVTDSGSFCSHLAYQKDSFINDEGGVPRRVAELCGHKSLPNGGVRYIEASWVATPAFPGAVKRSIISDGWVGPGSPYTSEYVAEAEKSASFRKAASSGVPGDLSFTPLELEMEQIAWNLKHNKRH